MTNSPLPQVNAEDAAPTTVVVAADLRPGMIVCDDHGNRRFAAFDVAPYEPRQWVAGEPTVPMVQVWTAIQDQDAGQLSSLLIVADDPITVRDAR